MFLSTKQHPLFKRSSILNTNIINNTKDDEIKDSLNETKMFFTKDDTITKISTNENYSYNMFKSNDIYTKSIDFNFNLEEDSLNMNHVESKSKEQNRYILNNLVQINESNEIITTDQLFNQNVTSDDNSTPGNIFSI